MSAVTAFLAWLPGVLYRLLARTGAPKPVQDVIVHVAITFSATFAGQLAFAPLAAALGGHPNWPALTALVTSAVTASGVAVGHYLAGLIPNAAAKAAVQQAAKTADAAAVKP